MDKGHSSSVLTAFLAVPLSRTLDPKPLTDSQLGGLIFAYVFVFIFGLIAIRQLFFSPSAKNTIRIDPAGICIGEAAYPWDTIWETAIMAKTGGNSRYHYLVLALSDRTYACIDLSGFSSANVLGFAMPLSEAINYFKPKTAVPLKA